MTDPVSRSPHPGGSSGNCERTSSVIEPHARSVPPAFRRGWPWALTDLGLRLATLPACNSFTAYVEAIAGRTPRSGGSPPCWATSWRTSTSGPRRSTAPPQPLYRRFRRAVGFEEGAWDRVAAPARDARLHRDPSDSGELVLRLLRGETLDAVSRESQASTHELVSWKRVFLDGWCPGGEEPEPSRRARARRAEWALLGATNRATVGGLTG